MPILPSITPGLLVLMAATVLLLASEIAGVVTTGSVALILVLVGLVLLLCGSAYMKALAFPLTYLIFMTPVLDALTEPLVWPFQLLTASMSVSMLQALGIPVLLEQNIRIVLPSVTLEVVRECSGAGLLTAVLAVGLPLAYLTLQAWWNRITLVLSSLVIAIVANWVRVTVMGMHAEAGGRDLHGPYHILQGLLVDWVAFGFLFMGAWLLGKVEHADSIAVGLEQKEASGAFSSTQGTSNPAWWLACCTLAAGTVVLYHTDGGSRSLKEELATTFPTVIGNWVADYQADDDPPLALPHADDSLARIYRSPNGQRVHLYVAYMKAQRQGKELVGMMTAPLHEKAVASELWTGAGLLSANRTFLYQFRRTVPAVFWYQIDGSSYADRSLAKLATVRQAFLRGRTDGALVLVSGDPRPDQAEELRNGLEEFAGLVYPLIPEFSR
jgi:EpsI family protein